MKKYLLIIVFLSSGTLFSQKLNAYKYAIIPEKFSFQNKANQFNFNNLVKAAFTKYGFESYFETSLLPDDVTNKNKVIVDVIENGSMLYTKFKIVIKDYRNNILFTSLEGKSKDKEYEVAYDEAFREAAKSLASLNHSYQIQSENEIVQELKVEIDKTNTNNLFAKPIKNGYNLTFNDVTIFEMLNTSKKDIYLAKKGTIYGIIVKIEDNWFFEYYKNEELVLEKINLSF